MGARSTLDDGRVRGLASFPPVIPSLFYIRKTKRGRKRNGGDEVCLINLLKKHEALYQAGKSMG